MNSLIRLFLAIALNPVGAVAALTPDDFASGLLLEIDDGYPMHQLSLPEAVYRQATRADLGDVRVFDADGREVRHRLIDRRQRTPAPEPRWVAVPYFPVAPQSSDQGNALNVRIRHDGALVEINKTAPGRRPATDTACIVDVSRLSQAVEKIDVILDTADTDFSGRVTIDGSRDLNRWTNIVPQAGLISLNYAGQNLRHTVVELQRTRWPYLRLRWLDDSPAASIKQINASVTGSAEAIPTTQRLHLAGHVDSKKKNAVRFDAGGYFPIVKVSVELSPNAVMQARLGSRDDPDSNWQIHHTGVFYALEHDHTIIRSDPVSVGLRGGHYWYLEDLSEQDVKQPLPALTVEWAPSDMVFLAEGRGPYTLAFGSGRIEPVDEQVSSVLTSLSQKKDQGMVGEARIAGVVELGGDGRRDKPPEPLPWQRILLWAILVGGVMVVAAMAVRLAKQIKR